MRVAVCLKAVWRTDVAWRLEPSGRGPRAEGAVPVLDPASRAALALALRLMQHSGPQLATLLAVTVGPPEWDGILRDALAWGATAVLRLWPLPINAAPDASPEPGPAWDGSAEYTHAKAQALAEALRASPAGGTVGAAPELVLTGDASQDSAQGCLGAWLAQALGLGFAHRVLEAERESEGWRVVVKLERGYTQELHLPRAAVLTVPAVAALPALPQPSMPEWLASRTASVPWRACSAPSGQSRTLLRAPRPRVRRIEPPSPALNAEQRIQALVNLPVRGGGTLLPASEGAEQQAQAALALLREKGFAP